MDVIIHKRDVSEDDNILAQRKTAFFFEVVMLNWSRLFVKTTIGRLLKARQQVYELKIKREEKSKELSQVQKKIHYLELNDPLMKSPSQILKEADPKFSEAFAGVLGVPIAEPHILMVRLREAARGFWSKTIFRCFRPKAPTYNKILKEICRRFKIVTNEPDLTVEQPIAIHFFNETWKELDPENQDLFREKLLADVKKAQVSTTNEMAKKFVPEILGASGILAAQASGFGVYLASSTLVGAVTHTLGATLPFAFYTTMSSSIAFLIGPAGGALLAISLLRKLFGPKYEKIVKAVSIIAGTRAEALIKHTICLQEAMETRRRIEGEIKNLDGDLQSARKQYIGHILLLCFVSLIMITAITLTIYRVVN